MVIRSRYIFLTKNKSESLRDFCSTQKKRSKERPTTDFATKLHQDHQDNYSTEYWSDNFEYNGVVTGERNDVEFCPEKKKKNPKIVYLPPSTLWNSLAQILLQV